MTDGDKVLDHYTLGMSDVLAERVRQKTVGGNGEGLTDQRDDRYTHDELILAAVAYATPPARMLGRHEESRGETMVVPSLWPLSWNPRWWKPTTRRRNLVKAAALLIAEIDRLDRL